MANSFNFVASKPDFFKEAALVDAFNLVHSLVDDVQFANVGEVLQPVHAVYIVKTEVNGLYVGQILPVHS